MRGTVLGTVWNPYHHMELKFFCGKVLINIPYVRHKLT